MGNLKCGISQKRLIVERNVRKFGPRGTTVYICRILLMPDSLSLVWGHSVHFAKIFDSTIFETILFRQILTKLHTKYHNLGLIQAITFLAISQKLKILWQLENFLNTGPYVAGNFKTLLLLQFSSDVSQTL